MTGTAKTLVRGAYHSATGLGIQILICGLLLWMTRSYSNDLALHVLWTSLAGAVLWLHLLVTYGLLSRTAGRDLRGGDLEQESGGQTREEPQGGDRMRFLKAYQRYVLPFLELGAAALLLQGLLREIKDRGQGVEALARNADPLLPLALFGVITLALIVFSAYLTSLSQGRPLRPLKGGRNYTNLMGVMVLTLLVAACGDHFKWGALRGTLVWGILAVNTFLAAETLFSMGVRFFAPRRKDALPRPAFDFYALEAFSQPMRIGKTFAAMLEGIFGFDIAKTSFGRFARALMVPALFLTAAILFILSSIVIVKPAEEAAVLNLGRLQENTLKPGLHLKFPWPIARVRIHNVSEVRSVHVGSHRPDRQGGGVFREGVPILWTNMHGISIDELLVCASPPGLVESTNQHASEKRGAPKAPSISMAAADVHVQYVIDDLVPYLRSSTVPEEVLRKTAEAFASRFIYRYDIDSLFCEARITLAHELHRAVQEATDKRGLGIRIVHVAITAVHPPVEVAGAFEETVSALQERETLIQQARQRSIGVQIEATGSTETFARLGDWVDKAESAQGLGATRQEDLLRESGGKVSQILSEAEAYRFSRENIERGKTERFAGRLRSYEASPRQYRYDYYLSVLGDGLAENRKVLLLGDTDQTIIRLGAEEGMALGSMPDEMGF